MLTKKEKKALDLLLRMNGANTFMEFIHDDILLKRVKMMGVNPYRLMRKVSIERGLEMRQKTKGNRQTQFAKLTCNIMREEQLAHGVRALGVS